MSISDSYLDLITSEHRSSPRFMATVAVLLKQSDAAFMIGLQMDEELDIDEAYGAQQDILGELVGQPRNLDFIPVNGESSVLDTQSYRMMLKFKVLKNQWDGNIESLEQLWNELFTEKIKIRDNQDMTMTIIMERPFTTRFSEAIIRGKVFPKPQSVRINYHFYHRTKAAFYLGMANKMTTTTQLYPLSMRKYGTLSRLYVGVAMSFLEEINISKKEG
mgnify:FL=1